MGDRMYDVTLHRLKIFTVVVDSGGIGAAAIAMGVSQPAISAHLKALEATVHQPLLNRRPGRTGALTEAGRIFYRYARDVILETENLSDILVSLTDGTRGHVTLAASRSIANFLLSSMLVEHYRLWPDVLISLHSGTLAAVKRLLINGTVGMGIVLSSERPDYFAATQIAEERLEIIATPRHHLAKRRSVSAAELRDESFVSALRSSAHFRMIDSILGSRQLAKTHRVMELDDVTGLKGVVKLGLGLAVVVGFTVTDELCNGDLVTLPLEPPLPPVGVWLISMPKHHFTPGEQRLIDLTTKMLAAEPPTEHDGDEHPDDR